MVSQRRLQQLGYPLLTTDHRLLAAELGTRKL